MDIYCINLASARGRKERMLRRFLHHKLLDRVHFVDAVDKESHRLDGEISYPITEQVKCELACFSSHLIAIQEFLSSGQKGAIICEDDVMFHNNFSEHLNKLFQNVPSGCRVVCLGHTVLWWDQFGWGGINPELKNLRPIIPAITWGCQCYWISRDHALSVVDRNFLKKPEPVSDTTQRLYLTSELITKSSNGLLAWPPLAVEEVVDSQIRSLDKMDIHSVSIEMFGYWNYSGAETVHLSQIYQEHQRKLRMIHDKYNPPKKKLLWISRIGYHCSYSYVSTLLLKYIRESNMYDLYVFCTGIVYTEEDTAMISKDLDLTADHLFTIGKRLGSSQHPEDHEYFNNYFSGIYHLPSVLNRVKPDRVMAIEDNLSISRQWEIIKNTKWDFQFKYIPYMTIDCDISTAKNWSFELPDHVVTMTEFARDQLYKVNPGVKVSVLPHVVDPAIFYPLPNKEDLRKRWIGRQDRQGTMFVVGAINANNDRKRWDILLDCFCDWARSHPDVILLMKVPYMAPKVNFGLSPCGEYDFDKVIKEACDKYKLDPNRIKIISGENSNEEMNEIYNCCDIAISTTSGEGWGLIPCEMSLCKIPQIVPNFSSFPEIFQGSSGLVDVEKHSIYVGRKYRALPETLKNLFRPIIKTYEYYTHIESTQNDLPVTVGISTVCISLHGKDTAAGSGYTLDASLDLMGHFRTVKYAIEIMEQWKTWPDRLQILVGLDPDFLREQNEMIQRLKNVVSAVGGGRRINYFLDDETLKNYYSFDHGLVGLAKRDSVIAALERFYQSEDVRLKEGQHCYDRIRQLCDPEKVMSKLYDTINTII